MDHVQLAKIANALSDPTRLSILEDIAAKPEMNCSEIVGRHQLAPGTVSHHLKTLAEAGLIETRREGQFIYNRAIPDTLKRYGQALTRLSRPAKRRSKEKSKQH